MLLLALNAAFTYYGGMTVTCTKCERPLPAKAFGSNPRKKNGLNSWCKECQSLRSKERWANDSDRRKKLLAQGNAWREANPDRVREINRRGHARNKVKRNAASREYRKGGGWAISLLAARRSQVKKAGREFTLTVEWVEGQWEKQGGRCHWFGIEMKRGSDTPRDPQKYSLERLDNSRDYTPDNCVLACQAANMGRGAASVEDWKKFLTLLGLK